MTNMLPAWVESSFEPIKRGENEEPYLVMEKSVTAPVVLTRDSKLNPGIFVDIKPSRWWRFPADPIEFGKHKGTPIDELPKDYIVHLLDADGKEYTRGGITRTFQLGEKLRRQLEKQVIIQMDESKVPIKCRWNAESGEYENY